MELVCSLLPYYAPPCFVANSRATEFSLHGLSLLSLHPYAGSCHLFTSLLMSNLVLVRRMTFVPQPGGTFCFGSNFTPEDKPGWISRPG